MHDLVVDLAGSFLRFVRSFVSSFELLRTSTVLLHQSTVHPHPDTHGLERSGRASERRTKGRTDGERAREGGRGGGFVRSVGRSSSAASERATADRGQSRPDRLGPGEKGAFPSRRPSVPPAAAAAVVGKSKAAAADDRAEAASGGGNAAEAAAAASPTLPQAEGSTSIEREESEPVIGTTIALVKCSIQVPTHSMAIMKTTTQTKAEVRPRRVAVGAATAASKAAVVEGGGGGGGGDGGDGLWRPGRPAFALEFLGQPGLLFSGS